MAQYDDSRWPLVVGLAGAGLVVAGVLVLLRMLDGQAGPPQVASRPEAVEPPSPENYPFPFPSPEAETTDADGPAVGEGDELFGAADETTSDAEATNEMRSETESEASADDPDDAPETTREEPGAPPAVAGRDESAVAPSGEEPGGGTASADLPASGAAFDEPVREAEPEPEPEPAVAEARFDPPYELHIRATARQVWVWVSTDGGPRQAVSLDRGETATFDARESYDLTVDDAGGVEATLNGEPLGPLGPSGQARRDITLPPTS